MTGWLANEGAAIPLGVTWIEAEQSYNFALYSKHARTVDLLLYDTNDVEQPCFTYALDYLRNKSGRIWHCRFSRSTAGGCVLLRLVHRWAFGAGRSGLARLR